MKVCSYCKKKYVENENSVKPSFCSKRCLNADLGMWFNEEYSIQAENSQLDDEPSFENLPFQNSSDEEGR